MSYEQFQERWEAAAEAELSSYRQQPVRKLLTDIARGKYGRHYQIWYALQGRTTLDEAGAPLLGVLRSHADYLVRYHCAALLLSLQNPRPDLFTPVMLSGREKHDIDRYLDEYEEASRTAAP